MKLTYTLPLLRGFVSENELGEDALVMAVKGGLCFTGKKSKESPGHFLSFFPVLPNENFGHKKNGVLYLMRKNKRERKEERKEA